MTAKKLIAASVPTDADHLYYAIRHSLGQSDADSGLATSFEVSIKAVKDWAILLNTLVAINRKAASGFGIRDPSVLLQILGEIANQSAEVFLEITNTEGTK